MRWAKPDTSAARRTAASRADACADGCSRRWPPAPSPTASARSPWWAPREPARLRAGRPRGGRRAGGLSLLRELRRRLGRLRPARRGGADPGRPGDRHRAVSEGPRAGRARGAAGGRGARREDGLLRRARGRIRPRWARPGGRVRHRGAHLRLPDRARPAGERDRGARRTGRGRLAPPRRPRGRAEQDGARRRGGLECRDRPVRALRARGHAGVQGRPAGDQVIASAYLLLEDGTRLQGDAVGAEREVTGEVVFTTGMSGYQESMTDPSFARQLITFTAPHVGNYGVSEAAMESGRIHAADAAGAEQGWLDWLREHGIPGISGVDTRALVRHIREAGAMRGGIFSAGTPQAEALERVHAEPSMVGRDLAREVTVSAPQLHGDGDGPRIIALDTGIKRSIIRNFTSRGAVLELYPCTTPAQELLERDPDGFFLVPGPGDPAALDYIVETIRELLSTKPVFGICLGHQLLSRAAGLETFKLPFGHRGANHPVKDVRTGRIAITSQNHGFAVAGRGGEVIESDLGAAELTHVNLYDGTVEGFRLLDAPAACVQYHPEAGPGPNDSLGLFDDFILEFEHAA